VPPVVFEDFAGPLVKPPVKAGDRAWVVVPVSGGWDVVKIALLPVLEAAESDLVVERDGRRYRVPGAFAARSAPATDLAPGDPVMAGTRGTRVFGRVIAPAKDRVTIRFKFAGKVEEVELAHDEVVELDGRPVLGAPVTISDPDATRYGQLVHQGAGKTWVVQSGGRPRWLPPSSVKILPTPPRLAVGDAVLAVRGEKLEPAWVTAVLDEGLQLEVKWKGGEDTATHTFDAVTRPGP